MGALFSNLIGRQIAQNRDYALSQGNQLATDIGGQAGMFQGAYGSAYNETQQALANLFAQQGYSQADIDQMVRDPQYQSLLNTDYASNFLSPETASAISGNPYAPMQAYDPGALEGIANAQDAYTRADVAQTGAGLQQGVQQTAAQLQAGIDPSKLGESGQYQQNVGDVLTTTANRVEGAIDPAQLGISSDYASKMNFTPQDVQDLVTKAGTSEGARYGGEQQQLLQRAIQQGNTSPAALASMQQQLNVQEGSAAGDAMTNARIAARQAQMQAAQQEEATRLGAEQFQTQAGTQAGEALGNLAASEVGQEEQLRMGGEQNIAGLQQRAATTAGQLGLQAGEFAGSEALQNEQNIGRQDIGLQQYEQNTAENLIGQGEQTASQRAAMLGLNQQQTNETNQANQFNRGMAVNSQLSNLYGNVAQQNIAGRNLYLQGVTGQEQQGQSGLTTTRGEQISNLGTTGSLMNQATGQQLSLSSRPSLGQQLIGAGVSAAGAVAGAEDGGVVGVDGPEVRMLGENGPELITPAWRDAVAAAGKAYGKAGGGIPGAGAALGSGIRDYIATRRAANASRAAMNDPTAQSAAVNNAIGAGPVGTDGAAMPTAPMIGQYPSMANSLGLQGFDDPEPFADGKLVTKPTLAVLGENGPEKVEPINQTKTSKMPPPIPPNIPGVRSRYQRPRGPSGPHGPERSLLPLKGLPAYR